ncbi:MAG: hypothetical protein M3O26_03245 [Pseudomonadota bacterium]|nr:hypothetical protein [Pseudomonadota bacterium]
MKVKTRVVLGAAAMAATIVGFAYATPIVGLVSPLFSVGQHASDIRTQGAGRTSNGQEFEVALETEGPATFSTQHFALAAGGHNGWHSHPGMVAVTIISGAIQWFDANCQETAYKAGDSWTEGTKQPSSSRLKVCLFELTSRLRLAPPHSASLKRLGQ